MKQVTIDTYSFDELCAEARKRAIEQARYNGDGTWWMGEAVYTLEAFLGIFGVKRYDVDFLNSHINHTVWGFSDNIIDLRGVRLATYLWNNYSRSLYKGKYYGKLSKFDKYGDPLIGDKEYRHVKRYSRCTLQRDCVLTGVCYDEDVLEPLYKFLDDPRTFNGDITDLLDNCVHSLCKAVQSEYAYRNSDEGISEDSQSSGVSFLVNGDLF
jgi:hypothetical protein